MPSEARTATPKIRGQITGVSEDDSGNLRAFLWRNGVMMDMNNLIAADSTLYLLHGFGINDRGQVAGFAFDMNSHEVHAFVATPVPNRDSAIASFDMRSLKPKPVVTLPDISSSGIPLQTR